ncbi:putative autophagy-related protein 11 isoform X2 [Biomphalaria glabrata]|uniref:Autophagy-related protein 11 isoform X2 n=1 Tax=Biomphalaria glabrata TaxID=6526 RepID=A0A9W3BFW4_BIOGL|nr:putative autophagy-related protein 11 isoform X2 [Biomphalaria glabrata]
MRTYQEVSHIVVQLLSLDEINEFLHNVFDEISLVKQKGVLWVEEKETSTFTELKEYITDKTSEILQRCISVASTLIEKLDDTASASNQVDQNDRDVKPVVSNFSTFVPKENQRLVGKINENCNTLQGKKLEKLQQKVKDQQLINKMLEEKTDTFIHNHEKENQLKLKELQENLDEKLVKFKEEIVTELHSASIFMTQLQTEWKTLLKEQKENNEGNLSQDIKAEVNDKIEKLTQEQKNLSNTLDDIIETHDRLEFEKEQFKKDLSDYKKKTDDLAKNVDNIDTIEKELKEIKASQSYHEQQIPEREEVDLLKYFRDCTKNPGHSQLIPVDSFSYTHLPEGYNDRDVYDPYQHYSQSDSQNQRHHDQSTQTRRVAKY